MPAPRTSRSSSPSATRPATGATSWSGRASPMPTIARQLNEGFVCVKVDREERPDVDEIYMTATQLITRSGGWPNSRLPDPRPQAVLRGDLLPAQGRHGPARLSARAAGAAGGVALQAPRAARSRPRLVARGDAAASRGRRRPGPVAARRRRWRARCRPASPPASTRSGAASVPRPSSRRRRTSSSSSSAPRDDRGARDARDHARPHGPRGPAGPAGRRLPSLLDRRGVAGAALREDAVRQRLARVAVRGGGALAPGAGFGRVARARRSTSCCAR